MYVSVPFNKMKYPFFYLALLLLQLLTMLSVLASDTQTPQDKPKTSRAGSIAKTDYDLTPLGYFGGTCTRVLVDNNRLFVTTTNGLLIFDISEPGSPALKGRYKTPDRAQGIFVTNDIAYIATASSGLLIIDVKKPEKPMFLSAYDTPGSAYNVYVNGSTAYVADGESGLQIIDVSNPSAPRLQGSYNTPGSAQDVFVKDDIAYVADGTSGLQIIDVHDPQLPRLISNYDTDRFATGLCVTDGTAFVADGEFGGLQIIDVSRPNKPRYISSYNTRGQASGVCVVKNVAYVADGYGGLQIIGVTNVRNPVLLASYDTTGTVLSVCIAENPVVSPVRGETSNGVSKANLMAYLADGEGGFQILAVDSPRNPRFLFRYATCGSAWNVYVTDDVAYIANGESGLGIIDIRDPRNPIFSSNFDTPGSVRSVHVVNNIAYVADSESGLQIIDVGSPTTPKLIRNYNIPGSAWNVYLKDNIAYIASGTGGLQILDVRNPVQPKPQGNFSAASETVGVCVVNNIACIIDHEEGLQTVDISNPKEPVLLGAYKTAGSPRNICVTDNIALIAEHSNGMEIIDISDPANPKMLSKYDTPGETQQICVVGDRAYLANRSGGLQIIDIKNPDKPHLVGHYKTRGEAWGVHGTESVICIAAWDAGLQIIGKSPPVLDPIADKFIKEGERLEFAISGSKTGVEKPFLMYSAANLPRGASFDPVSQTFSWRPGYDASGVYDVTFMCCDDSTPALCDSKTVRITVTDVNNPPQLKLIGNKTVIEGKPLQFTVSATDVETKSDALTFSATGMPQGASFNPKTRRFSWTPGSVNVGNHEVTFAVTDNGTPPLSATETVKIAVERFNPPPVIEHISDKKVSKGAPIQISIKAASADSSPGTLTYSATPLPKGASIDPSTGIFSWEPTCADVGTHIITFSCCDNGTPPQSATETVKITVTRTNSRPVIEPISDMSIRVNEPLEFTINATDPDAECDTLTYSAINLPDGASFDHATRIFSWKPGNKDVGTHIVIFMCCDSAKPPLCDSKTVIINVY